MSLETLTPTPPTMQTWPVLSQAERRVLGVLAEKNKTTPEVYPMSVNALVAGCNQKSNRDPILNLGDVEVEDTLAALQKKGLTTRISGGRVERWRHNLYEQWQVGKVEMAIVAELLLRGPQTEGELRGRASRMEPIDDLDQLRALLQPLKDRGLVVYLGPERRRGTQLTHGFHDPHEMEKLRLTGGTLAADEETNPPVQSSVASSPTYKTDLEETRAELASLQTQVRNLQAALQELTTQVQGLKEALGN